MIRIKLKDKFMSTVPKKNNEIIISPSTISTRQIAQYFDIEIKKLNKIFLEFQWLKKKYFLWLVTTELGVEKGAKKKNKEILWNRNILADKELIEAIKKTNHGSISSENYLEKIEAHYKKEGYTLWNYAKEKGIYNKNIHFVAKKQKEVFLIHCPIEDITLDNVLQFEKSQKEFLAENLVFEMYQVTPLYVMANFLLDEEAFKYLNETISNVSYTVIK